MATVMMKVMKVMKVRIERRVGVREDERTVSRDLAKYKCDTKSVSVHANYFTLS